jgi:hypothetical protein
MNAEMVARIIQTIIVPVVMITTCSIMLGGLLSHYAAISDRLRALARERIDRLRAMPADSISRERLDEIDAQLPELLRRHKLVRDAALSIYSAIVIFVVGMFVIAFVTVPDNAWLTSAIIVVFLLGMAVLLIGVLLTTWEIRQSHRAVEYEAQRVLSLPG